MHRGEPLTDAKRAELTKQFDQRLAERQAKQQAIAKACQGKTDGTAIALKLVNSKLMVTVPFASSRNAPAPVSDRNK